MLRCDPAVLELKGPFSEIVNTSFELTNTQNEKLHYMITLSAGNENRIIWDPVVGAFAKVSLKPGKSKVIKVSTKAGLVFPADFDPNAQFLIFYAATESDGGAAKLEEKHRMREQDSFLRIAYLNRVRKRSKATPKIETVPESAPVNNLNITNDTNISYRCPWWLKILAVVIIIILFCAYVKYAVAVSPNKPLTMMISPPIGKQKASSAARSIPNLAATGFSKRALCMMKIMDTNGSARGGGVSTDDIEAKYMADESGGAAFVIHEKKNRVTVRVIYTREFVFYCAASPFTSLTPAALPWVMNEALEILRQIPSKFDINEYNQTCLELRQQLD